MTHCNTLNMKLSQSQLSQINSGIKNGTGVTVFHLMWSAILMIKLIFLLLLGNTQVSKICKAFANGSSANIKFSKTQLSKII